MRRLGVILVCFLAALFTTGCIVESPPSRYWIENNSDSAIVLQQTGDLRYPDVIEVAAHQKVEVTRTMTRGGCRVDWEIVDEAGRQLRAIDKICEGDTIVFP